MRVLALLTVIAAFTTLVHAREARFAWEPVPNVDGYSVWVQTAGGEWTELVQVTEFDPAAARIEIVHACPDGEFRSYVTGWANLENESGAYGRYHSDPSFILTIPAPLPAPSNPEVIPMPVPLSWQAPQDDAGESRRMALQHSSDLESWQVLADGSAALKPHAFFRLVLY